MNAIVYREAGLPRALEVPGGANVFFRWKERDRYHRVVEATRKARPVSAWREVVKGWSTWTVVAPEANDVTGVQLPAELQPELDQIRRGANALVAHRMTAAEWLRSSPLAEFTEAINTELTARYGHGFVGEIYAAHLESRRENQAARAELDRIFQRDLAAGESASFAALQQESAGVVMLVSMGLGWDREITKSTKDYVRDFLETVQALGIETHVLDRKSMGTMDENIPLLKAQVEARLAAGKDVILFSLCKGALELMAAAAAAVGDHLDAQRTQTGRPAGSGRILGVLNLSAMLSGIVLADKVPTKTVLGTLLSHFPFAPALRDLGRYMLFLPHVSTPKVHAVKEQFLPRLPSDALYVDAVGVVPGNGLLTKDIGAMKPFIDYDRKNNLAKAANDGFVIYPGNELPRGIAEQHVAVVVSGSHMLFDGAFGAHSLEVRANKVALMRSLVRFVLEAKRPTAAAPPA